MEIIPAPPEGVTIETIAKELGLKLDTARRWLWYADIRPMYSFGNKGVGVYPLSALDAIKDMKRGRPIKDTEGK